MRHIPCSCPLTSVELVFTLNSCICKLQRVFLQLPILITLICVLDIVAPCTHSSVCHPFPGLVVTMPRVVRSTRNATKKKELEKDNSDREASTTNIKTTTTNSARDPSVDNYKLHFELTDLEPTKSTTTPHTDQDIERVLHQDQRGGVGDDKSQGLSHGNIESSVRVNEDRDGSGEPDHTSSNIDQPRDSYPQQHRYIPRSTSPNNNKYPIDPHLSYIPQYLQQTESESTSIVLRSPCIADALQVQQHYSHHHDSK